MYIHPPTTTYPYSVSQLKRDNPQTSFPKVMTDAVLASWGVFPVRVTQQPEYDPTTQRIAEVPPVQIDGAWTQQWEVYALPAEDVSANRAAARAAKWEAIKAERDRRKALGVKVDGHWFHSDADSRIQQISLFVMGAAVPPIQWKTLTTTPPPVFVTMTQSIAAGIFQATAASDAAIFTAAETHRIAMEASPTPETYDFTGGWPASIEDEA